METLQGFLRKELSNHEFARTFRVERGKAEMELAIRDIVEELKLIRRALERMLEEGLPVRGDINLVLVGEEDEE